MLCPGCRKDSKTRDFCSNCMRPFTPAEAAAAGSAPPAPVMGYASTASPYFPPAAAPLPGGPAPHPQPASLARAPQYSIPLPKYLQPKASMPAQAAPMPLTRVSLTGEIVHEDITQPISPYTPPPLAVTQPVRPYSTPVHTPGQAAQSVSRSIHGARVAAAQLGPSAISAQFVKSALEKEDISLGERWERSLAIIFPVIAASLLLVHFVPAVYVYAALFDFFVVGLALGATRAIQSFDDAYMDCTAVLAVSYACCPVAGIGAYLLVGLIKQEWNTAVLAVLLGHILVRAVFVFSFPDNIPWFSVIPYFAVFSVTKIISFTGTALTFGGWMMSNFFRPLNEG
jgi:hypothetical protein